MKRWCWLLLWFAIPAFAQTVVTTPISSIRNVIDSDVLASIKVTPLDGASAPLAALAQPWPASPAFQASTPFTFAASATAYTLTGFRVELITTAGTGFKAKQSLILDYTLSSPLAVPRGVTVLATVNAPLSGLGSLVATLGPLPPPPAPSAESSSGTELLAPGVGSIVDHIGGLWALGPKNPAVEGGTQFVILHNGAANGAATAICYVSGVVYVRNEPGAVWYKWTDNLTQLPRKGSFDSSKAPTGCV